jgi:universal stress protein A
MLRIQTILVPIDFSETASQALDIARALARDHGAKLVLLNAPVPPPPVHEVPVPETELTLQVEEARNQLKGMAAQITDLPVETHVMMGDAGPAIVATAKERQADLIVMGTHGRSGLSRLLMGSVAEAVLRHAPCPVLTIKAGTAEHLQHDVPTSLATNPRA